MTEARVFIVSSRAVIMACLCFAASLAQALPPTLSELEVADVTPSSITLIWDVDQTARHDSVRIFQDAAGTIEITSDFETRAFPLIGGDPSAADEISALEARAALTAATAGKGLARVRIDGLTPNTTYYVRARSAVGAEAAELPIGASIAVTTADVNSFITRSQQLNLRFQAADPTGWVVLASSADTVYPVSAVVGDGAAGNEAYLNLAQMFNAAGDNYEPVGATTITLHVRQGGGNTYNPSFEVNFIDGFAVGLAYLRDIADPGSQLQMIQPAVLTYTEGQTIVLAWVDALPAGSEIALYFDSDDIGTDGTAIVTGLDADADGAGDSYSWDTAAVPDGIYWVYAQGSNGGPVTTSYAPAPLAIDRAGLDSDFDDIADLWEQLYFGDLSNDGADDGDLDGRIDSLEFADRTLPTRPDFRLRALAGLNFVSWPIAPDPGLSSAALINALGGLAESIERIDNTTQQVDKTSWDGSGAAGAVFPIVAEEGYMLRLATAYDGVFAGVVAPADTNLGVGVNLVGFNMLPGGYSAFQLMAALGGEAVVASVSQLNQASGRFRSAGYAGGTAVGFDFPIVQEKAYLIHLKQAVNGFSP